MVRYTKGVRRRFITTVIVAVIILAGVWWFGYHHANAPAKPADAQTPADQQNTGFDKHQYSLTDPASIWVIVNKQHPLNPLSYVPPDLTVPNVPLRSPGQDNMQMRAATASALSQLFAGAKKDGINLEVASGYRSYTYQQTVYGGYVQSSGQTKADEESARPGYSEHQTGLAVDIASADNSCTLEACFGTTPAGQWLAANAYQYGFILRYPADKVAVTGYEYEPWHFRYVGTALSQQMHKDHIETLEEFFGVKGGTTYN